MKKVYIGTSGSESAAAPSAVMLASAMNGSAAASFAPACAALTLREKVEKASFAAEQNVYTFDIASSANKTEIKKAVFSLYKVHPVKVNVLTIPTKKVFQKGKAGVRGGGRKAFVYLKKGDKIDFI